VKVKVNVQWACHPCTSRQMRKLVSTLQRSYRTIKKPSTHPTIISYKAEDTAAITQAKQLHLGNCFLLFEPVKEGKQLVRERSLASCHTLSWDVDGLKTASKLNSRFLSFHMCSRESSSGMMRASFWPRLLSNSSMGRTRAYTRILPFMSSIMLKYFLRMMLSSCMQCFPG